MSVFRSGRDEAEPRYRAPKVRHCKPEIRIRCRASLRLQSGGTPPHSKAFGRDCNIRIQLETLSPFNAENRCDCNGIRRSTRGSQPIWTALGQDSVIGFCRETHFWAELSVNQGHHGRRLPAKHRTCRRCARARKRQIRPRRACRGQLPRRQWEGPPGHSRPDSRG